MPRSFITRLRIAMQALLASFLNDLFDALVNLSDHEFREPSLQMAQDGQEEQSRKTEADERKEPDE